MIFWVKPSRTKLVVLIFNNLKSIFKGLVTMEPITPMDSCEYNQFQKSFSMAKHDFNHHNVESSRNRLNYCLSSLGRFRATSTLEGITSVLWSAFLYFSNKSGIKWFVCCLASKLGSDAHTGRCHIEKI